MMKKDPKLSLKLQDQLQTLNMSGAELARRCDVDPGTVSDWVHVRVRIPVIVIRYLDLLATVRSVSK